MDRVQVRGRVGFKIILSEVLGMLRIVPFLPQRRSFYAAALQTSVAPLSPRRGATEGNRQGRNTGAPQKDYTQHCLPWDRRLDLSGFCSPRRATLAPIRCVPHTGPNPAWPWPWLPVNVALQTAQGQRLTQQPHIRHGSSPPCQCWMVNHHKTGLLECVTEFRQRRSRKARNEITAIQQQ